MSVQEAEKEWHKAREKLLAVIEEVKSSGFEELHKRYNEAREREEETASILYGLMYGESEKERMECAGYLIKGAEAADKAGKPILASEIRAIHVKNH